MSDHDTPPVAGDETRDDATRQQCEAWGEIHNLLWAESDEYRNGSGVAIVRAVALIRKALAALRPAPDAVAPVAWQKCPVCEGQGLVVRPPHIAGDQPTWTSSSTAPYPCRRCAGTGTIAVPPASAPPAVPLEVPNRADVEQAYFRAANAFFDAVTEGPNSLSYAALAKKHNDALADLLALAARAAVPEAETADTAKMRPRWN